VQRNEKSLKSLDTGNVESANLKIIYFLVKCSLLAAV